MACLSNDNRDIKDSSKWVLRRPIITAINTHPARVSSYRDTDADGGLSLDLSCDTTPLRKVCEEKDHETIFFIDSTGHYTLPDAFKEALKNGIECNEPHTEGQRKSNTTQLVRNYVAAPFPMLNSSKYGL